MNREDVIELLDMDDDDLDSYCSDPDEPVMSGSDDEFSDLEQENVDDAECNVERKRKHRPDNDIDSSVVVETYGCWGTEAKWALSQLASRLAMRLNSPKSTTTASLYGRLSITLVRANVRALLSRAISLDGF
eukprot:Em0004g264a